MNALATEIPFLSAAPVETFGSSISIFGRLNLEWAAMRNDPVAAGIVAGWAASDPDLAGLGSLALIEAAKAGPVDGRFDAMFSALARRAVGDGVEAVLAARILLQLMLPKASLLAGGARRLVPDPTERAQLAVSCMYLAIRTLPARITTHVPPHLAWNAHALMRQEAQTLSWDLLRPNGGSDVAAEEVEETPAEKLSDVLAWAVAEKVITAADAALLTSRYRDRSDGLRTGPIGTSWLDLPDLQQIADQVGASPATVKKRCSRATQRLARAAAAYLNATA